MLEAMARMLFVEAIESDYQKMMKIFSGSFIEDNEQDRNKIIAANMLHELAIQMKVVHDRIYDKRK
jgi:hypothetical protein